MAIYTKRVYETRTRCDGRCFFVERLWPRGVTKENLPAEMWLKNVAPSAELRIWFGHRRERWETFCQRYRAELDANPESWRPVLEAAKRGTVTLLYSTRDQEHNAACVLRDYVGEKI